MTLQCGIPTIYVSRKAGKDTRYKHWGLMAIVHGKLRSCLKRSLSLGYKEPLGRLGGESKWTYPPPPNPFPPITSSYWRVLLLTLQIFLLPGLLSLTYNLCICI